MIKGHPAALVLDAERPTAAVMPEGGRPVGKREGQFVELVIIGDVDERLIGEHLPDELEERVVEVNAAGVGDEQAAAEAVVAEDLHVARRNPAHATVAREKHERRNSIGRILP